MVKVTLGAQEYDVGEMDIGQIEEVSALDRADPRWSFKTLAILMRDAVPKIADIRKIKATPPQIGTAIREIMVGSGYEFPNQQAPEKTGQPSEAEA